MLFPMLLPVFFLLFLCLSGVSWFSFASGAVTKAVTNTPFNCCDGCFLLFFSWFKYTKHGVDWLIQSGIQLINHHQGRLSELKRKIVNWNRITFNFHDCGRIEKLPAIRGQQRANNQSQICVFKFLIITNDTNSTLVGKTDWNQIEPNQWWLLRYYYWGFYIQSAMKNAIVNELLTESS